MNKILYIAICLLTFNAYADFYCEYNVAAGKHSGKGSTEWEAYHAAIANCEDLWGSEQACKAKLWKFRCIESQSSFQEESITSSNGTYLMGTALIGRNQTRNSIYSTVALKEQNAQSREKIRLSLISICINAYYFSSYECNFWVNSTFTLQYR